MNPLRRLFTLCQSVTGNIRRRLLLLLRRRVVAGEVRSGFHRLSLSMHSSLLLPHLNSSFSLRWFIRKHQYTALRNFSTIKAKMSSESYNFGPYKISPKEVFYSTPLSYALVNLRPVVPDVLVCPRREVKRFQDLTADETSDLWLAAKRIGTELESFHKASSLTFTIQDGPESGQTVPHVHIHILPRKANDFEKNDEIYDAIDDKEKELNQKLNLDKERKDRSFDEMAQEAEEYRKLFL